MTAVQRALEKRAVPHAWLFHGPEGVGKELTALRFAQALVCATRPWEGCETCTTCMRVMHRNHPDVMWLMPEAKQIERGLAGRSDFTHTPSRDIRIEQVRQLQARLAFRALEAAHKVAILIDAHQLNIPAQNALLKTLEEPPLGTILILVSSASDKLLPTIRSRCAKAAFGPLTSGRAIQIDAVALAQRHEIIETFAALKEDDAIAWLAAAEKWGADREAAELALITITGWLRDVALTSIGVQTTSSPEHQSLATAGAQRLSPARLQRWLVLVEEAKNAIFQRNGSSRLQLERMLAEMMTA